jgi:predicted trehalose synthase
VQLTASRRDMGQAETLLADAVARLLACLPALGKANGAVGASLRGTDDLAPLAQAVVNMQFQDLVSQLLRRADERLAGLDKLLQQLVRILNDGDASALHAAAQCLGSQTLAPERRTSSSIQQMNMAPGDVELF